MVKVIQVIISDLLTRGTGKAPDAIRRVTQVYDFDGKLIAENDPVKIFSPENVITFGMLAVKHCKSAIDVQNLFEDWSKKYEKEQTI